MGDDLATMSDVLTDTHAFEPAGGGAWMPMPICAGPWDRHALHGGPSTALVGRAILDHEPGDTRWFLARLTVELIKPVPMEPLRVEVVNRRPGRRVQVLDATITTTDGTEVLWARGVRLAETPNGLDEAAVPNPAPPSWPAPESCPRLRMQARLDWVVFGAAYELRAAQGAPFAEEGPAAIWSRLLIPLLAGEEIHPLDRALTLADFPNGFGNAVPFERFVYINPDLTVSLHRLPAGEWVLMDALMQPRATGHGVATGALFDVEGPLGMSTQSLLISAR